MRPRGIRFPVDDLVAYLLDAGTKEDFLDDFDVETFVPLEGVEPFTSDTALVLNELVRGSFDS